MQIQFVLMLFILAFGFLFVALWSEKDWNQIIFGTLGMIMFFVSGGSASVIHKPYVVVTENTTENAMTPYTAPFSPFPGIFLAIAIIGAPTIAVALKTKGEDNLKTRKGGEKYGY